MHLVGTVKRSSTLFVEAVGYSAPLRLSIRWHRTQKNSHSEQHKIVKLTQVLLMAYFI